MEKSKIRKYAELIAKVGCKVKKGQEVNLVCSVESYDFIRIMVEELYKAGAGKVNIDWSDTEITKLNINYESEEKLSEVTSVEHAKQQKNMKDLPVRLYIESDDPDALKGVDQEKYGRATTARQKVIRSYRDQYDDDCQWCIAACPGLKWAKKIFPALNDEEAIEALWEAILKASRAYEGDPNENWLKHDKTLNDVAHYLNGLHLHKLHYTASNGTDLHIELLPNVKWLGGGEFTKNGETYFQPNIPTEEVFTSPNKFGTEGIVYSSKPLSYRGEIIDKFSIRFHEGKAVEVHAERGEELLKNMIKMDENACYLGECALLPFDSPINNLGIIFFNTLFDENAACHLALGMSFSNLVEDYTKYTPEEIEAMGMNKSVIHVDFMIGVKDLCIEAESFDGSRHLIFKDGNWNF